MNNATGDNNGTGTSGAYVVDGSIFVKRGRVARPSMRPLNADFYRLRNDTNLNNASQTAFSFYSLSGYTAGEEVKHQIHWNKPNVSYVDGHVTGPEEMSVNRWPKKLVQFHLYDTW